MPREKTACSWKVALVALLLGIAPATQAGIVNIDLDATDPNNGALVFFTEGATYTLQAVSGGAFGDAWNPWGVVNGAPCDLGNCNGWANFYFFDYVDAAETDFYFGNAYIYATAADAVAAAEALTFTAAASFDARLYIKDEPYFDNVGGMRIRIESTAIPEPGTLSLLGIATVLFLLGRRRTGSARQLR